MCAFLCHRLADESICNGCPESRDLSFWNSWQGIFACFGKRVAYIWGSAFDATFSGGCCSFTPFLSFIVYLIMFIKFNFLQHRLSDLTDYCTALKVKHSKLRRKRNYVYQEDSLAFSNNTPNSSPKIKLPNIRS